MLNTGKLAGRVIFISGASRGIGKEIALKAARDGARIVVAAKTAEPHPKLEGTIYSAAEDIRSAGGEALPCVVDIRDEEAVQAAVQETVRTFGGIDILVNNASAINLTSTLETSMKKYDLMNGINSRGTYLVSRCCLPYLKKGTNPHILNISPPLNMNARWFRSHVAYTIAKYGMSMCALGMAEEFKSDGIAVNALWPKTAIYTAAMQMLAGDSVRNKCRSPAIMADAAYVMLTRDSRAYTGNFDIDESVLRSVGVTDFSQYSYQPNAKLIPDFFLDPEDEVDRIAVKPGGKVKYRGDEDKPNAAQDKPGTAAGGADNDRVAEIFKAIEGFLSADLVQKVQAIYQFNVPGHSQEQWFLDMRNGSGSCGAGVASDADCTMTMKADDFHKVFSGQMKPTAAFMSGKMKISGDMGKAMKLESLMSKLKAKL